MSLSLLGNDLYRKLLVIQELCRQQWDMYVRKSHQIEDRIVSIDQPHVRPIVRGKAGCSTEFGAKVIVGLVSGYAFLMKADWNDSGRPGLSRQRKSALVHLAGDPSFRSQAGTEVGRGEADGKQTDLPGWLRPRRD